MTQLDDAVNQQIELEHSLECPTRKERIADVVSEFGGSWTFIGWFVVFFFVWIAFNVWVYPFDPYPFILLNLILSCLSVFQAPFILMSQNRASNIDRVRAEHSYKVDLKAELEIQALHRKIDSLMEKK